MLDIEFVRKNKSEAKEGISARGYEPKLIDQLLEHDEARRKITKEVEDLRAKRNTAAKGKDIEAGKKLKGELEEKEETLTEAQHLFTTALRNLPNLPKAEVPVGEATKAKVVEEHGKPTEFSFQPKDHLQLGEWLDIIDTQSAAKVSGSRFAYLKNEAALLELALVNFAMERLVSAGFTPIIPPTLIKPEITENLGYWQHTGRENYYLAVGPDANIAEALYLVGTAEHAIVPMHAGETLPSETLPRHYVAYSPAYRRESGAYGKDTRGIIRVHQFEKVEMVVMADPSQADEEFKSLIELPWSWMKELGLPVRKVILSSEDMSFPAAETVDIETWFPSQNAYRETHSISTTTDFQSRRLGIKSSAGGYVHILNGTAFAIGRTLAAILENNQREDGSVGIPSALQPFAGFAEIKAS
jgi:seryl-tRNA synthetase